MFLIFLQSKATETEIRTQGLMDVIMQGGLLGMIIVGILFFLSIMALYIFIERYFTINRASKVDDGFMNSIRSHVQAGKVESALALCETTDSPVARLLEKGIQRIGRPLEDIEAAIENVGNLEVFKLEKNLSTLASIAGAAPMIGFFGTVTGMILAFYKMATVENVTPNVLSEGIYQALITTAAGLFIGILAFVGYNWLVTKVQHVVFKMEKSTLDFMDLLQEPAKV